MTRSARPAAVIPTHSSLRGQVRAIAVLAVAAAALLAGEAAVAQPAPARVPRAQGFDRDRLPRDIFFKGPAGESVSGLRCGTPLMDAWEATLLDLHLQQWRAQEVPAEGLDALASATLNIKVAFHVVHNGASGNVPEAMLNQQIAVLNAAFSSSGFRFTKAIVTRTNNAGWYTGCAAGAESPMKGALRVDPKRYLNIYTCKPAGGILGYAYLPGTWPNGHSRDGVVVLHSSLPGGTAAPYNRGDTATHEVGHYLGLYHTFDPEPNGCRAPGDRVADTPDERSPQYGCPALGRVNTCSTPGADPVTNFMDYVDDACMNRFTPLQGRRMRDLTAMLRPGLTAAGR